LIYNGQEVYNTKRLEFFERDPIDWTATPGGAAHIDPLLRRLITLKTETSALWNGAWGARMVPVINSSPKEILSFTRRNADSGIFAVLNLSASPRSVTFSDGPFAGSWTEVFTGESVTLDSTSRLNLPAWGYRVYRENTPK
jgi:hypothetical protein